MKERVCTSTSLSEPSSELARLMAAIIKAFLCDTMCLEPQKNKKKIFTLKTQNISKNKSSLLTMKRSSESQYETVEEEGVYIVASPAPGATGGAVDVELDEQDVYVGCLCFARAKKKTRHHGGLTKKFCNRFTNLIFCLAKIFPFF